MRFAAFCFCLLLEIVLAVHIGPRDLNALLRPCYDYIVVGGGISGLVVANRLTEDPDVTVLVIEAGTFDSNEDAVLVPEDVGDDMGSMYDWNLFTTPQKYLDGKPRPYDLGKALGGGSIINGMCWNRGGREDYDAWVRLGNLGWGWNDLFPYFKKSENYTFDVDAEFSSMLYIHPNESTHGHGGYVHVSYPKYFYNQSQNFLEGMAELGIPILTDPNNGTGAGAMLIPNDINPDSQTRSHARRTYYEPFSSRPNFHVVTGQFVTRLLIAATNSSLPQAARTGGVYINGVEFAANGFAPRSSIFVGREVILSAGAVHTPQILQISGIGPAELLTRFDVPVMIDLPGVGNNFQDHAYVGAVYQYNNYTYVTSMDLANNPNLQNAAAAQYYSNKTGPWTAGAINTVAFPCLKSITEKYTQIIFDASIQDPTVYLLPGLDPTLIAGYKAQHAILVQLLASNTVGAYELLNNNYGLLSVSAMHTFSRGIVMINSSNAFDAPLIDPRWCSNPIDCDILVEALLFNNQLVNTTWMAVLHPAQFPPYDKVSTRETLMDAVHSNLRTEFHGTGTTSMMPLELGGVVDTSLRVYGTSNLRVVDAGIMPLVPAAHLQAVVYAVAEKAADIIKLENFGVTGRVCMTNTSIDIPRPERTQVETSVAFTTELIAVGKSGMSISTLSAFLDFNSTILPADATSPASLSGIEQDTGSYEKYMHTSTIFSPEITISTIHLTAVSPSVTTKTVNAARATVLEPPATPSKDEKSDAASETLTSETRAAKLAVSTTTSPNIFSSLLTNSNRHWKSAAVVTVATIAFVTTVVVQFPVAGWVIEKVMGLMVDVVDWDNLVDIS